MTFLFLYTYYEMAIILKLVKPAHSKTHNSLKVSNTNIRGFHSNFLHCESYLRSHLPDILALCETNLDETTDSNSFCVNGYLPLI